MQSLLFFAVIGTIVSGFPPVQLANVFVSQTDGLVGSYRTGENQFVTWLCTYDGQYRQVMETAYLPRFVPGSRLDTLVWLSVDDQEYEYYVKRNSDTAKLLSRNYLCAITGTNPGWPTYLLPTISRVLPDRDILVIAHTVEKATGIYVRAYSLFRVVSSESTGDISLDLVARLHTGGQGGDSVYGATAFSATHSISPPWGSRVNRLSIVSINYTKLISQIDTFQLDLATHEESLRIHGTCSIGGWIGYDQKAYYSSRNDSSLFITLLSPFRVVRMCCCSENDASTEYEISTMIDNSSGIYDEESYALPKLIEGSVIIPREGNIEVESPDKAKIVRVATFEEQWDYQAFLEVNDILSLYVYDVVGNVRYIEIDWNEEPSVSVSFELDLSEILK